jgi:hypothetical protein
VRSLQAEIEERLKRPWPGQELRRLVREQVAQSIRCLREAEDVMRLELRDDIAADRIREGYEYIDREVLNGRRDRDR